MQMEVPTLGSAGAAARIEEARKQKLRQAMLAQTPGEDSDVPVITAFIVYRDLAGNVNSETNLSTVLIPRRPPTWHDVQAMCHAASSQFLDTGGMSGGEVDVAFIIYQMMDGTIVMNADLNVPVIPDRPPVESDLEGMTFVIIAQNIAQATANLVVNTLTMQAMAMPAEAQNAGRPTFNGRT